MLGTVLGAGCWVLYWLLGAGCWVLYWVLGAVLGALQRRGLPICRPPHYNGTDLRSLVTLIVPTGRPGDLQHGDGELSARRVCSSAAGAADLAAGVGSIRTQHINLPQ